MATIYLHIGAPKTATSTLQALLAANFHTLLEGGVLYPERCRHGAAHHVLVCDLIEKHQGNAMPDFWYGDYARGLAWQALGEEIRDSGPALRSVVLSSELFFGQTNNLRPMLDDMARHLAGHTVRIVVYLRRQDQLYSSFYNQDVKGVRQWPDNAYRFFHTHQMFQVDYCQLLNTWAEVFGRENLLIRPYEPQQWRGGAIARDFCTVTGLPDLRGAASDSNTSLGATQLCIKRALNRVGYDKAWNDDVVQLLLQLHPEPPTPNLIYVNRRLYDNYRRQWRRVNASLSEQFLQGRPLFTEDIPPARDMLPYAVDGVRLAEFVRAVLRHFGRGASARYRALYARAALLLLIEHQLWERFDDAAKHTLSAWA
ncbi:MAG: hypothetical protein KDI16_11645 [Halioglobus sp.]|nr:hypothetical protein [Halioglobus sp.]